MQRLLCSPADPLDINPSVDFLFDCSLVAPEDVGGDPDLPRSIRKVGPAWGSPPPRKRTL